MKNLRFPTISPIIRITVGLLFLTISLLLVGDLLGIVPNQEQSELDARKAIAESLAIQVSSEIGNNNTNKAMKLLDVVVRRNKNIYSMGLRATSGEILIQSDKHEKYWVSREDDKSTPSHMKVPIYGEKGRWGILEISFEKLDSKWNNLFKSRSFAMMILFVLIFGFIAYWFFLKRVLSELDPRSVVPERVRSALDALSEGLVILDTNERIVLVNTALKKKLGLDNSSLVGKTLSSLAWEMKKDDASIKKEELPWNMLLSAQKVSKVEYLKLKTKDGRLLTFDVNVSPVKSDNNKLKGAIVTIDDVTELEKKNSELAHLLGRLGKSQDEIKRQNSELVQLATRDSLTDALNRRALYEGLESLLLETKNHASILSCIMLDIDHFKKINDTYGHAMGDKVIQHVVNILQQEAGVYDLVGRYGGEEFIVILPEKNELEAKEIAENIRYIINTERDIEFPDELALSATFGVSSTENNVWKSDALINNADLALYEGKSNGRDQVVLYTNIGNLEIKNDEGITLSKKPVIRQIQNQHKSRVSKNNQMLQELPRTVIFDRLTKAIHMAERNKKHVAVLSISVDTIRMINNTLGYASAEKLRKIVFDCLSESFRTSDSIIPKEYMNKSVSLSNISDNEFIIILLDIENKNFTTWAILRILKALSHPVEVDGNEVVMTANIGASVYKEDGENAEVLLKNANMALEKAKKEGRGEFLFYNQDMNEVSKEALKIESQLSQALEKNELYLVYQPILSIETGEIQKFEALLRWEHPELGLVSTEKFIEIAEYSGIIKRIGLWVISQASKQLKIWNDQGYKHIMMSINLSAVQLNQIDLVEKVVDIVEKEGISPKAIVLELTETILIKQRKRIGEIIWGLHKAGFVIALDDFGTGYSSLEHLHKFPINLIKIDRSFMADFPEKSVSVSLISGLISLCHNLGIRIIAEGIEEEGQIVLLNHLDCDEVQGYLISHPLKAEDANVFLASDTGKHIIRKINMIEESPMTVPTKISIGDVLNTPPNLLS